MRKKRYNIPIVDGYVLECNAFKKEINFYENGKIDEKSKLMSYGSKYSWELDVQFIRDLVEHINKREITLQLIGSVYDCEELKCLIDSYKEENESANIILQPTNYIISDLNRTKELKALLRILEEGNVPGIDTRMINEMKTKLDEELEIVVVATMSSGKSTLINSILGREIMPSKNEACTATIVKIKHDNSLKEFKITEENGKTVDKIATLEALETLNNSKFVTNITLQGNIQGLSEIERFTLVDTPGPNNSLDLNHRKTTYDYIKSNKQPIILFILDGTKILTDDEVEVIKIIGDQIRGRQNNKDKLDEDRFIFIVNKCDNYKKNKDSTENIKNNIINKLSEKEIGIENPKIFFTSAYNALLVRKESLNEEDEFDFNDRCERVKKGFYTFHAHSTTSQSISNKIIHLEDSARRNAKVEELVLLTSGLRSVELTIVDIVKKYKNAILVKQIMQDCKSKIEMLNIQQELQEQLESDLKSKEEKEQEMKNLKIAMNTLRQTTNSKETKQEIEKELKDLKFNTSFKPLSLRVHIKIDDVWKKCEQLPTTWINEKKLVSKSIATSYLNILEKTMKSVEADIISEMESIIRNDLEAEGQRIIEKYKETLQKVLGNVQEINVGIDVKEYIMLAIPDFKEFMAINTKKEEETKPYTIENPEKQGLWGKLMFWKPSHITLSKTNVEEGVEIDEVRKIVKESQASIGKLMSKVQEIIDQEKAKIKVIMIGTLDKLDFAIEQSIKDLEIIIGHKQSIEQEIKGYEKNIEETREKVKLLQEINRAVQKVEAI